MADEPDERDGRRGLILPFPLVVEGIPSTLILLSLALTVSASSIALLLTVFIFLPIKRSCSRLYLVTHISSTS